MGDQVQLTLTMGRMLRTLAVTYNEEETPQIKAKKVHKNTQVSFPCTIAGFLSKSYGKFGKSDVD